jgi:hypothetical protein
MHGQQNIKSVDTVQYRSITLILMTKVLYSTLTLVYPTSSCMCAVFSMAVLCSVLMSCFTGVLYRYFMNDFEIVPVALQLLVSLLFLHFQ